MARDRHLLGDPVGALTAPEGLQTEVDHRRRGPDPRKAKHRRAASLAAPTAAMATAEAIESRE